MDWLRYPLVTLYQRPATWYCCSCCIYTNDPHWCDCVRYGLPSDQQLTRVGWRREIRRSHVLVIGLTTLFATWIMML